MNWSNAAELFVSISALGGEVRHNSAMAISLVLLAPTLFLPELLSAFQRAAAVRDRDVHVMGGQSGWELVGSRDYGGEVRNAIVKGGREFGIWQIGSRAYPTL